MQHATLRPERFSHTKTRARSPHTIQLIIWWASKSVVCCLSSTSALRIGMTSSGRVTLGFFFVYLLVALHAVLLHFANHVVNLTHVGFNWILLFFFRLHTFHDSIASSLAPLSAYITRGVGCCCSCSWSEPDNLPYTTHTTSTAVWDDLYARWSINNAKCVGHNNNRCASKVMTSSTSFAVCSALSMMFRTCI